MAPRTQKAAAKAKAAKPAKAKDKAPAAKAKGRKPKAKPEEPMVFEELAPEPARPGFFARLHARRAAKAEERARRREEEAARRAIEAARAAEERAEAEARERAAEAQRLKEEAVAAAAAEKARAEQEAQAALDARKAEQQARRDEKKAERAEAKRLEAERLAAEEAAKEEARRQRAEERKAKRAAMAAEEERLVREQAERDAREEAGREAAKAERAIKAAQEEADAEHAREARREEARAARAAKSAEPEPDMEFQEQSKRVDPAQALVPSEVDAQADKVAQELSRRRSKPVVIEGDDELVVPKLPSLKGPSKPDEAEEAVAMPPTDGPAEPAPRPMQSIGHSLPEAFLLLANDALERWDERSERNKPGYLGGALAGAMLLELVLNNGIVVLRDRLTRTGELVDDPALEAVAARLRKINEKGEKPSFAAMAQLAKGNRELLLPFKQRLAEKGLAESGSRRFLGMFYRSYVRVVDEAAVERLRNRLRRAIAGGGTPEAATILLLGLLDAVGLLESVVPAEAMDYNRKRLNGLLGGRDIMGYKVDPQLKGVQEVATRTILGNVRLMTRG